MSERIQWVDGVKGIACIAVVCILSVIELLVVCKAGMVSRCR